MISVICFSKDRPLQLDAYISSLHYYSAIPFKNMYVIYTSTGEISYETAIATYPDVKWIKERDFFSDFENCVLDAEEFVLLGCDDVVFKGYFDPNVPIKALVDEPQAISFSLRLGANLHSLPKLEIDGDLLRWNWRAAGDGNWGYPWDVSASIYRREFIKDLIGRYKNLTNPNRLEAYIAEAIHDDAAVTEKLSIAYKASKCLTLTINRVQDEYANDFDESSMAEPSELFAQYNLGRRLNWPRFADKSYNHIHIDGQDFELVDQEPSVGYAGYEHSLKMPNQGAIEWSLPVKIAFWGFANRVKERIRPLVPRTVFRLARRFL